MDCSPAILASFGEVDGSYSEEARTRGFASLTMVKFAFTNQLWTVQRARQFWDLLKSGMVWAPLDERLQWVIFSRWVYIPTNGRFRE